MIVKEHHQAVRGNAGWIMDPGPGAGSEGGEIVFGATPAELVQDGKTLTGQHLAEYVR